MSANVQQSIAVPLSVGYESNPQFLSSNPQALTHLSFNPSYSINSVEGLNKWSVGAKINIIRNSKKSIRKDRSDPSVNLAWSHDYETGQFSVNGLLNTRSTQVSELTDSGIVKGDNTQNNRSVSVRWLNNLSERTSLTLSSSTSYVSFSGLSTTGLVGYQNDMFSTGLNYIISEKLQTSITLSNSSYKPKSSINSKSATKSANFAITWNTTEKLSISTNVGASETRRDVNPKSESWLASLTVQYATLKTNSSLNVSRTNVPSSTGSINERDKLSANWAYSLSERDNIVVALSSVKNISINSVKIIQYSATYRKNLSLSWNFQLTAKRIVRLDGLTNVDSNSIMTTMTYKLPDF